MTPDELAALWRRYKAEGETADRNALVERYLPLVKYNASRIWARLPDGVDLDDLISAGVFGLMDAMQTFDLARGVKFETYCVPRVRGAMLDELREADWVPRLVRARRTKLDRARRAVEAELGRPPCRSELAERLGYSPEAFAAVEAEATPATLTSLDKKWYETDGFKDVREIDVLADDRGADPALRQQKLDVLKLLLRGLNPTERCVIVMYYYDGLTMKEIGAAVGLGETRVSQIHQRATATLHRRLRHRGDEFAAAADFTNLPEGVSASLAPVPQRRRTLGDPDRPRVEAALSECGGDKRRASELLGVCTKTLKNRLYRWEKAGVA